MDITRDRALTDVYGVVISAMKYKESSKILKLFTRDFGVITVYAQGAMRPKSGKLLATSLFCHGRYALRSGREWYYLGEAEAIEPHFGVMKDLVRLRYAASMVDLVLQALPESEPHPEVYALLEKDLILLDEIDADRLDVLYLSYLLKFSTFIGYRPSLLACAHCGNRRFNSPVFSSTAGGILCENCHGESKDGVLNKEAFDTMVALLMSPTIQIIERGRPATDIKELTARMLNFIAFNLNLDNLKPPALN